MDDKMLLDGLFILIAVLFVPIGFRRGIAREVFVTAGILAGATLARSWARPWGGDLSDLVDARQGAGIFAVSAAFVIGGALVLGYGGAAAARMEAPRGWARVLGAFLAVANGGLIAGFLLRDIELYLADDGTERSLEESYVANTLLREFGWVLVGLAALAVAAIVIAWLAGERRVEPSTPLAPTWQPATTAKGKRKRRLGWGRDDGKVEPPINAAPAAPYGQFDAETARYGATMPIAPVAPASWSMDRAQGRPVGSEWLDVTAVAAARPAPESPAIRCLACGERLTNDDAFCPRCGRART